LAQESSFLSELTRRNVWRVGITYVIGAWLILQVLETVASITGAPDWIAKFLLVVMVIGLPVVLLFAWAYEVTPEGIRREKEVDRSESITHATGARLNKITIGIFIVAVGWVIVDRTILSTSPQPASTPDPVVQEEIVATEIVDKSIAVLPFMNMSEDAGAGHFSDGLADTVLHKLAQIRSLHVVARNSSFQFRGQNIDIREVGEQLNVATVLEGSVQAAGNTIRVTAQLIEAETGYHLWSGNFDRELDDVFGIQDEIAEEVVNALQVSLGTEDSARLARRDTESVEAFREYSLALREMDGYDFESLPRAIEHLDKAIAIDPDYALAWAAKGLTYRHMSWVGTVIFEEGKVAIRTAAENALELDPELPLAMALIAELDHDERKFDTAIPLIEQAVALAPSDATILGIYASVLQDQLRPNEAADSRLRTIELDPLSIPVHQAASALLIRLNRHHEARELVDRMRVLNPDAAATHWASSYVDADTGNWARSIMSLVKAHELDASDPITTMDITWNLLGLGLEDVAIAWIQKTREIDATHPAALASLLTVSLADENLGEETVRIARELMIDRVPDANSARGSAYDVLLREACRTGYFDEYLAWVRHFEPEMFDPEIDDVNDDPFDAITIGSIMILAGQEKQGQKLIELGQARRQAVFDAYETPPNYGHFFVAALLGDRDRALQVLGSLKESTSLFTLNFDRDSRHYPWIAEYRLEPAYQEMVVAMEQRAAKQREKLLELNGGEYPLPD